MLVKKRTGEFQEFKREKIYNAILAAAQEVGLNDDKTLNIIKRICKEIRSENEGLDFVTVEELQNQVEEKLMGSHLKNVARAYIRYRYDREKIRNSKEDLMRRIGEKLMATNVENQNANVDERSFGGRVGEASRVVTKEYALDYCMSEMARSNHLNNEIYIHDLDSYCIGQHNCLTVPIDKLLAEGFNTRQVDIRPAGSLNTAFQLLAVVFQIQSLQQFGGVSASHIDWSMVPYVRKSFYKHYITGLKYCEGVEDEYLSNFEYLRDKSIESEDYKKHSSAYRYALDATTKECHQAVEGMFHNLNSLQSRSGRVIAA